MVHRIALITGAAAAAGILVLALGVGGLFARSSPTADAAGSASSATSAPAAQTKVETVYVKPAPPQRVIHVTQTAHPAARQAPRTVIVHRAGHGGDDEGGHDGGNDGGDD